MNYLFEWFHIYFIHFTALVAFFISTTVTVKGLPKLKEIQPMLLSSVILSSLVAVFSSHAHHHYLDHFLGK